MLAEREKRQAETAAPSRLSPFARMAFVEAKAAALEDITWDLSHLLRGGRGRGRRHRRGDRRRAARPGRAAGRGVRRQARGQGRRARRRGPARGDGAAGGDLQLAGRAANFAHLRFSADTEDPANGALMQMVSERGTAIQTKLLFFELEWVEVPDDRAEELLATEGLDFCRHHLRMERRYKPHLLSKPEETISTELSVTGRSAWSRLFDELTSAIRVELDGRGRAGLARRRPLGPVQPRPRAAQGDGRGGDRGARARPAHPRLRLQHAAPGQGDQGPAARLPELARLAQPRQRGLGRVGSGAGRGGQGPLRPGPALVRDQGEAARPRAPRRLRPHGRGLQRRRGDPLGAGARAGHRLLRLLLWRRRGRGRALLRRALDRRASDPGQARRRLQRLDRPLGPPLRAAQLHGAPPRRAHARARARPRPAPDPGPRAGRVPPGHAADGRRDGLGVRRGDRLRAAAGRRRGSGLAPQPAGRGGRGPDRHRLPPDRDEPVRGPRPHRPPRRGRAGDRAHRRALDRDPDRAAGRLGRDHRGLPLLVVLRPPLHRRPRLRLRLRLRPAAGALGLPPLHRARRRDRPGLPGDAVAPAARAHPRSWARSSASTSPTPASGSRAWTWSPSRSIRRWRRPKK